MKKKKKLSAGAIVLIVVAALLALALIAGAAICIYIGTMDTIYPNVYVAGSNVGGMTQQEAEDAINAYVQQLYGASTLTSDRRQVSFKSILDSSCFSFFPF